MTPRTDMEIWWVGFKPDERLEAVWADFARDLEKENAALRADIQAHEQINRQLIEDKRRLDWLERNGPWDRWIDPDGPDITLRKPIRECIDAYRKEAQP